jgi:hypothetical protein
MAFSPKNGERFAGNGERFAGNSERFLLGTAISVTS